MTRGRKKEENSDEILQTIAERADELIQDGKLVPYSSDVFLDLSPILKKSVQAVYLIVKRRFSEIFPECTVQVETVYKENDDSSHRESVSFNDSGESQNDDSVVSFDIDIDPSVFVLEQYIKKTGKQQCVRQRVKGEWGDKLYNLVWCAKKLHCAFTFKFSYVDIHGSVSFSGACTECGAVFGAKTNCSRTILTVKVTNYNPEYKHCKRRYLKGDTRRELGEKLKEKSAFNVHREMVKELIATGNTHVPANLPRMTTLKNLKYKDSIESGKTDIDTILEWKNSNVAYKDTIFDVSISPFFVFYHLPVQREFYLAESKKNKMAISIDATGSIIKPPSNSALSPKNLKLKHIYLYNVMLKTDGASIPIFQMISQKHTARFISYWLGECFFKIPILCPPSEVVCDDSKAFLLALVKTFTIHHSVKNYIGACIRSLETGRSPPECYIRLDRSHFIKTLIRKIADKDVRKRDFYRQIFGYLIQCTDYREAKSIIADFFTVILNKFVGSNGAGYLPAEKSKQRLQHLLTTHEFNYGESDSSDEGKIQEENSEDDEENDTERLETVEPDDAWLQQIIAGVQITNDEKSCLRADNIYYCDYEKDKFRKIFTTLPLWSNVMNNIFGSQFTTATSQDVESNFNTVKNRVLDQKMVRADKFLSIHVNYLKTEFKLRMAEGMTARESQSTSITAAKKGTIHTYIHSS